MKILLLHPEDSPRRGAWAQGKWDLLVDLGSSSESAAKAWSECLGRPASRLRSFSRGHEDLRLVRAMLDAGRGVLLDEQGLDWWELTALLIHEEMESVLLMERAASGLRGRHEIYASRPGWEMGTFAALLGCEPQIYEGRADVRFRSKLTRRYRVLRDLSTTQLADVLCDKYDPAHCWRRLLGGRASVARSPVTLVPSAYTNVSRMATEYARLLPDRQFLFVATRQSGMQFDGAANISMASLSRYAHRKFRSGREYRTLLQSWETLLADLRKIPVLDLLLRAGKFDKFPDWFRHGLAVRDAWNQVLELEPVTSVLCGDDSNPYTRIPVLLARKKGLPTIDFHHGALDGRFLLKRLPADFFLAKSEMERDYLLRVCEMAPESVVLGAPAERRQCGSARTPAGQPSQIVFFSEPYESGAGRADEVYRELLPPLAGLARRCGMSLVIKLHPFESKKERSRLVRQILPAENLQMAKVVRGPLSGELLRATWFGVTVESTTALDCTLQSVPCFLCPWLESSSYGYLDQYARFGVGLPLKSAAEIETIPRIMAMKRSASPTQAAWHPIAPDILRTYMDGAPAKIGHIEELESGRLMLTCEQDD